MTKLLEWVAVFGSLGAVWLNLIYHQKDIALFRDNPKILFFAPLLLLITFGVSVSHIYAASVVLYRVFTFNNCEEAAKELQEEIKEARSDLKRLGFIFDS